MTNELLPDGRRDRIVAELRARGMLRVSDLAELLGVAPVTLRRDIARLAAEGVVRRLHGGAVLNEPVKEVSVQMEAPVRVGMLVPSLDFYWPEVIRGAQDMAEERGAVLMLRGTSYEDADFRAHATHLIAAGVDALLMAPDVTTRATMELLEWLQETEVPFVLVERDARGTSTALPFESVTTDHLGGAGAAVRHLAADGHTRVGFVWNPGSPHREEIRRGWALAVQECGLRPDAFTRELRRHEPGDEAPAVAELVRDCIDAGTTALLVHADREAIAIAQQCQEEGLSVPGDLSIIAYDDEVAGLFSPALTAVRPPRISIGRAAMGLVMDRLRDAGRPTHRVVITPRLNVRESTGPTGS
ncbi:substrate-binding domain-containing protein [Tessaracoccus antarcticus]|uniref:DeoR family transcriptional regulator n=1 Tax=Tessaracoccus antarcticus TaxID=2479848 RepID=A0A3M0GF74_9ACTN|nr:substrate-binding domain-containing protein [Tessaracoccus antarcticus]RMB60243.1 DeoR family transcriptional regulator [Tessaracoccus antarcticus]